jgi:hypothetical protein
LKKAISITFTAIYAFLTVGVNVMVHTCGGSSETILQPFSASDPCMSGMEPMQENEVGMSMSDMCCTTEITTVKIDDTQLASAIATLQPLVMVDLLSPESNSTQAITAASCTFQHAVDTSPPPREDLSLINSVFLI